VAVRKRGRTLSSSSATPSTRTPSPRGFGTAAVNHQAAFAAAAVTGPADQAVLDGAVLLAQTALGVAT
jgi:hypothetical protein